MAKSGWSVPTLDIIAYLKAHQHQHETQSPKAAEAKSDSKKKDAYSIFDDEFVAYRNRKEIAELYVATGLAPKSLVAFRPERAAWHEAIVAVSTTIQTIDEEDMQIKVMTLYEQAFPKIEELAIMLNEHRKEHQELVTHTLQAIKNNKSIPGSLLAKEMQEFYERLKSTGKQLGTMVPGYDVDQATIAYFTDKLYREECQQEMQNLIELELKKIIKQKKFIPLSKPNPENRTLFMVAGGCASGKGSSVSILMRTAEEQKIDWADIVKTNGDSYKPLLLEPGTTTPEIFSQYAQEEAGIIKQAIQTRLEVMTEKGLTPHVFVDQTAVGQDRLDMILKKGGRAFVVIVSTDVADAIERAHARGQRLGEKGRYEHTEVILNAHKQTTIDSKNRLAECVGKQVVAQILDNNVAYSTLPIPVMTANFANNEVIIHDKEKLNRFLSKTCINQHAKNRESVYQGQPMTIDDYLAPLVKKGMKIVDQSATMDVHLTQAPPRRA